MSLTGKRVILLATQLSLQVGTTLSQQARQVNINHSILSYWQHPVHNTQIAVPRQLGWAVFLVLQTWWRLRCFAGWVPDLQLATKISCSTTFIDYNFPAEIQTVFELWCLPLNTFRRRLKAYVFKQWQFTPVLKSFPGRHNHHRI